MGLTQRRFLCKCERCRKEFTISLTTLKRHLRGHKGFETSGKLCQKCRNREKRLKMIKGKSKCTSEYSETKTQERKLS